jgi:transcriptional regulator with XRE-family HTH domain
MKISGRQIAAARDLLGITQQELAEAAGVSKNTLIRFETGQGEPHAPNKAKIEQELFKRGIEFTNGTGIGVRLDYEKAQKFAAQREGYPHPDA